YDGLCATTLRMWKQLQSRSRFRALHAPESNILCFRWIGDGSFSEENLDAINLDARERYNRSGEGWVTTTVLNGRRVLRVTIMNPRTTAEDTKAVLDGLDKACSAHSTNPPTHQPTTTGSAS